jgi:hypothetical protein
MIQSIEFLLQEKKVVVPVTSVLAAGYTGRDQQHVQEHVTELEEQGIAPPPHIPMLYPVMPTLLSNSEHIAVLGPNSTPEIEVAIVEFEGERYVTVASDQTDREIEAASVPQSKNACPKIVGVELWHVDDVLPQWDSLQLRSSSSGTLLQEGTLGMLLPLHEILAFADKHAGQQANRVLLSGTVPTLAVPSREGATILLELHDPVSGRSLSHSYTVHVMNEFF